MLYLVPTPIGNMEDMTYRGVAVLQKVDLILAEDTRTSKHLFDKYEISTRVISFHTHNEHSKLAGLIRDLESGMEIALISDAGTPGISDPGFLIVREAVKQNIPITCLPGATALVPAIVMSGIPCDRFHFEGFLPQKKGKKTRLEYLLSLPNPFILYESPFRVVKTLKRIKDMTGDDERQVSVCREISKIHEESIRGQLSTVIGILEQRTNIKGEIVIVISGNISK